MTSAAAQPSTPQTPLIPQPQDTRPTSTRRTRLIPKGRHIPSTKPKGARTPVTHKMRTNSVALRSPSTQPVDASPATYTATSTRAIDSTDRLPDNAPDDDTRLPRP